ncbi:hypothetical protein ACJ41O_002243 [Fusarium nematophilum]
MSPALQLPQLRVLAKSLKLEIAATPSLCIDLPSEFSHIATIKEVLTAVKYDHLWIDRIGICCIEMSVAVNDCMFLENDHLEAIANTIRRCEVWDRLGLRLERRKSCRAQLPGLISFSIEHPNLKSALAAPAAARSAAFQTLILAANISKPGQKNGRPEQDQDHKRASKRRKKPDKLKAKEQAQDIHRHDLLATLALDDQQAVESFMSSLNFPVTGHRKRASPQKGRRDDKAFREEAFKKLCSSSMMGILLEQLLLAPEKTYRGYEVATCAAYCLTSIMPGVFHMPYLKDISDRAQLLPVVATSLARMRNAESPVLRQKVAELRRDVPDSTDSRNEWENIVQGIERRA